MPLSSNAKVVRCAVALKRNGESGNISVNNLSESAGTTNFRTEERSAKYAASTWKHAAGLSANQRTFPDPSGDSIQKTYTDNIFVILYGQPWAKSFGKTDFGRISVNQTVWSLFMKACMWAAFWLSKVGMGNERMAMNHSFKSVQTSTESVRATLVTLKDQIELAVYDMSLWKELGFRSFARVGNDTKTCSSALCTG